MDKPRVSDEDIILSLPFKVRRTEDMFYVRLESDEWAIFPGRVIPHEDAEIARLQAKIERVRGLALVDGYGLRRNGARFYDAEEVCEALADTI